jgi:hypothetical protein
MVHEILVEHKTEQVEIRQERPKEVKLVVEANLRRTPDLYIPHGVPGVRVTCER